MGTVVEIKTMPQFLQYYVSRATGYTTQYSQNDTEVCNILYTNYIGKMLIKCFVVHFEVFIFYACHIY